MKSFTGLYSARPHQHTALVWQGCRLPLQNLNQLVHVNGCCRSWLHALSPISIMLFTRRRKQVVDPDDIFPEASNRSYPLYALQNVPKGKSVPKSLALNWHFTINVSHVCDVPRANQGEGPCWRSGAPQRRVARGAPQGRRCTYALLYAVEPAVYEEPISVL